MNDATFVPRFGKKLQCAALKIFFLLTITTSFRALANQNVILTWDPSDGAVSYNVYYGTASGNYTQSLSTTETSVIISNLIDGVTYYFAVTAVDAVGIESLPSDELSYAVPLPDLAPSVPVLSMRQSSAGQGTITFSITANGPVPSRWTLQASPDLLSWNAISTGTNATSMTIVVAQSSALLFRLNTTTPGVFLAYQIAQPNPLPNSFFITTTGSSPDSWTVEASADSQSWTAIASGVNSPVNIAVLNSNSPQMFFRLKSD